MPKQCYVPKNFQEKTLLTIAYAQEILEDYEEQGFSLTLRQLYYQFVSAGDAVMEELGFPVVDGTYNNEKSYNRLGNIVNNARLAGLIDWEMIEDRTRGLQYYKSWDSPAQIIWECMFRYNRDKWEEQEYYIEVWIEKDALTGVIEKVCYKWNLAHFSCRGYTSQSEMWKASQRLLKISEEEDRVPLILHLGDHDPSGIDMTRDIRDRLEMFECYDVEVVRLGLNLDQINEYNPPPNPAKVTDSRYEEYVLKYGYQSWELDALEPRILNQLIEDAVGEVVDFELFEKIEKEESDEKRQIKKVSDNWEKIIDIL